MEVRTVWERGRAFAHVVGRIQNWPQVAYSVAVKGNVGLIRLRRGEAISAPGETDLWNHYNDIHIRRTYTKPINVPRGGTVVDVGANVGLFSIEASRRASCVLAVEPSSQNFRFLEGNVRRAENVRCVRCALGGVDGVVALNVGGPGTSYRVAPGEGGGVSAPRAMELVPAVTLDTLFDLYDIETCDFLKLDCEGGEFELLRGGARRAIARIRYVVAEYHETEGGRRVEDLSFWLQKEGFSVWRWERCGGYGLMYGVNRREG